MSWKLAASCAAPSFFMAEVYFCRVGVDRGLFLLRWHWKRFIPAALALAEIYSYCVGVERGLFLPRWRWERFIPAALALAEVHSCRVGVGRDLFLPRWRWQRFIPAVLALKEVYSWHVGVGRGLFMSLWQRFNSAALADVYSCSVGVGRGLFLPHWRWHIIKQPCKKCDKSYSIESSQIISKFPHCLFLKICFCFENWTYTKVRGGILLTWKCYAKLENKCTVL